MFKINIKCDLRFLLQTDCYKCIFPVIRCDTQDYGDKFVFSISRLWEGVVLREKIILKISLCWIELRMMV